MSRFELVVADTDREYVENLSAYIMMFHSYRFRVHTFSDRKILKQYLSVTSGLDILMAHESIMPDSEEIKKCGCIINLSEGHARNSAPFCGAINKYQHMEQLVSQILAVVSDGKEEILKGLDKRSFAKVLVFFSPAGGLQKTAAALSMAVNSALNGSKVFYLGFDKMQMVEQFYGGNSEKGMSDVIYHLKENSLNLEMKIDSIKKVDSRYGINYFGRPQNLFDLGEIQPDEFKKLIKVLKYESGCDYLILDMAGIDKKIPAVIPEADGLFIAAETGILSVLECRQCVEDLIRISHANNLKIENKLFLLHSDNIKNSVDLKGLGVKIVPLPDIPRNIDSLDIKDLIRPGTLFSDAVSALMEIVIAGDRL